MWDVNRCDVGREGKNQGQTTLENLGYNKLNKVSFTTRLFETCDTGNGDSSKLDEHGILGFFSWSIY